MITVVYIVTHPTEDDREIEAVSAMDARQKAAHESGRRFIEYSARRKHIARERAV